MSSQPPLPPCPECGRRIAAWKKDHCVYCGTAFPADFKQGFAEPEALKWVDRPVIPPDAERKLEMMKVVPMEAASRGRSISKIVGLLSVPIFGVLFYLVSAMLRRFSPLAASATLAAGAAFLGYLIWSLQKTRRR